MARRMLIDATHPEETRVVVINGNRLEEFDFETSTKKQIKGNIYLAKITRVEPSLQAAFVEYGGNRHGFLAFSEIHPDYYRIPVSDREAMLAAERAEDEEAARYGEDGPDPTSPFQQDPRAIASDADGGDDDRRFYTVDTPWTEDRRDEDGPVGDAGNRQAAPALGSVLLTTGLPFIHTAPAAQDADTRADAALTGGTRDDGSASGHATLDHAALDHAALDDPRTRPVTRAQDGVAPTIHYALADPEPQRTLSEPALDGDAPGGVAHPAGVAHREGSPAAPVRTGQDEAEFAVADETSLSEPASDLRSVGDDQGLADGLTDPAEGLAELNDEATVVETVGGDEFEDVQARPRARHYRHYKIQEVIKRRQIILIQVTKEERGNKGAALTTYLSLAGRYCVLMPNAARGGGVSRKITSAADRRRLKELMEELEVPDGMGVIVRTAGSERSKQEIKRDYEYLLRLWDDIRDLTLRSSAPALIYEEGSLIKRAIRDLYSSDIEEILVEGEEGYRTAKEFMRMLMPSHASRVKLYRDPAIPLFHRFQVDAQIDQIHNPVCQLRSGGYIVINPTEALVSIDVNSGRATKERNIEETATKTNLEAAEEIARQLRLRDLAGLVVIDFIDMEDLRNQKAVEGRLKDAMKQDRARIQLGRISPFGLLELSRQRLRSSLIEASTQICPHCNGSGTIRSTESTALVALRALEEEGIRRRTAEIELFVPTQIAFYLLNQKRDALAAIENRYGFQVIVAPDDLLIQPAYRLERVRPLSLQELANLPTPTLAPPPEEEDEDFTDEDEAPVAAAVQTADGEARPTDAPAEGGGDEEDRPRRKRRRRKRRRVGGDERDMAAGDAEQDGDAESDEDETDDAAESPTSGEPIDETAAAGDGEDEDGGEDGDDAVHADGRPLTEEERGERKRRRRGKRGGRRRRREDGQPGEAFIAPVPDQQPPVDADDLMVGYPPVLDFARDGREHIFTHPDPIPAPVLATAKQTAVTPEPKPEARPEPKIATVAVGMSASETPAITADVQVVTGHAGRHTGDAMHDDAAPVAASVAMPVVPDETGPSEANTETGLGEKPKRTRRAPARRKSAGDSDEAAPVAEVAVATDAPSEKPKRAPRKRKLASDGMAETTMVETMAETMVDATVDGIVDPVAAPITAITDPQAIQGLPIDQPLAVAAGAPNLTEAPFPIDQSALEEPATLDQPAKPDPLAALDPPPPRRTGWWRK